MLRVENLGFQFPHMPLFRQVNFEVAAGEILHLRGPNGAGKSTMLAVIAGLLPPTAGSVTFDTVTEDALFEYLPADANGLFFKLSAEENLRFWKTFRKDPGLRSVTEELQRWGLVSDFVRCNLPVEKFSTGMRRRLALARVTASTSRCWLLDEPVNGLDQGGIALFQQALHSHRISGGCALVVCHDYAALGNEATRIFDIEGLK